MTGKATVTITSLTNCEKPPSSRLVYEFRNGTRAPVWLVDDDWLIWRQRAMHIELSYARGEMRPGTHVFGYFPPSVLKADPGERLKKSVRLTWPQKLDQLWNEEPLAAPPPGEYLISVRLGYGLSPEPGKSKMEEGVEAPVFRWQKEVLSQEVTLKVPQYYRSDANGIHPMQGHESP